MKISLKKLEICMAREKMSLSDLAKAIGMSNDGLSRLKNKKNVRPATIGKIADALQVDVTDILEDMEAADSMEFQEIVDLAKAGDPMPKYCRSGDKLIYDGLCRAVVDFRMKRITAEEAERQHRELEHHYNALRDLYDLCRWIDNLRVSLAGYKKRSKLEENSLAAEIMDKISGIK